MKQDKQHKNPRSISKWHTFWFWLGYKAVWASIAHSESQHWLTIQPHINQTPSRDLPVRAVLTKTVILHEIKLPLTFHSKLLWISDAFELELPLTWMNEQLLIFSISHFLGMTHATQFLHTFPKNTDLHHLIVSNQHSLPPFVIWL